MKEDPEFFGSDFQIRLQQALLKERPIIQQNPKLNFGGRSIGLDNPTLEDSHTIAHYANKFGALSAFFTAEENLQTLTDRLASPQLDIQLWQHFQATETAVHQCHSILEEQKRDGYHLETINSDTPTEEIRSYQTLMQACGVAPLPGYVLRGNSIKSVSVMVKAPDNTIVATAVGLFRHHPKGECANAAHVGYLATHPDHRRKGLAKLALAKVNHTLIKEYQCNLMHTGIKPDNIASKKTCEACGLSLDGKTYLVGFFHKEKLSGGQFTR